MAKRNCSLNEQQHPLPFCFNLTHFPFLSFHIQVYLDMPILYNFMVFVLSLYNFT